MNVGLKVLLKSMIKIVFILKLASAFLLCEYKSNQYYGYSCALTLNGTAVTEDGEEYIHGNHKKFLQKVFVVKTNNIWIQQHGKFR